MSHQKFKKLILVLSVSLVGLVTLVAVKSASTRYSDTPKVSGGALQTQRVRRRNLSLRPAAFNMARRLGGRFSADKPQSSYVNGSVRHGSENHLFQMVREQAEDGELVEISLDQTAVSLRWEAKQGASSSGSRASARDRELIERLVFDSPDQFVLAQLRGAAYSTIARNVSSEAGDPISGAVWDVVRIDDPEADELKRPESRWRLYYVNQRTGLIDRVVSEVRGEKIQADLTGWTNSSGETFPSRIIWSRAGATIMEVNITALSRIADD